MDTKRKLYIARCVLLFVLALALFVLISLVCDKVLYFIAHRITYEVSEDVIRFIHILLSLLAYHSFLYAFVFTDNKLKSIYNNSGKSRLTFIFSSLEVYISLAITAVFFLAFSNAFAVDALTGWTGIGKGYAALILGISFLILLFVTWLESITKWKKTKGNADKNKITLLIRHCISACLAYPIMAYMLPIFFPTFRTFPSIAKVLLIALLPLGAAVLLISFSVPVLRAFFIRSNFIRKIKKASKKHGYELSEIRHPYSSIFADHKESSFTIVANGKTYACKLLSGIIYQNPMYFAEEGNGTIVNSVRFRAFFYGTRGLGRIGWYNSDELARLETHFTYGFEGEGKKVLIVCPTPHTIYATGYGENRLLDVADEIWGYTLMTGTSFINALERDCI